MKYMNTSSVDRLENKMHSIEDRLGKLEKHAFGKDVSDVYDSNQQAIESKNIESGNVEILENNDIKSEEPKVDSNLILLIHWLKKDWLMKLGALLLLLALGWFVSYTFLNNWIGPVGRISLGVIFGIIVLAIGHWQMPKYSVPGQTLVAVGGVMILISLFTARTIYDFFTPVSALAMMSLVIIVMAIISVVRNTRSVAIIALLGGAIAPLLIGSPDTNQFLLISYISILNLGALVVSIIRNWKFLIIISLVITGLHGFIFVEPEIIFHLIYIFIFIFTVLGISIIKKWQGLSLISSVVVAIYSISFLELHNLFLKSNYSELIIWLFMGLFFALFFIFSLVSILHYQKTSTKVAISEFITIGLTSLIFILWVYKFVPASWQSTVLVIVTILMAGAAFVISKIKATSVPIYIYAAIAVVFLGVATVFELDGEWVTVAFSLEALVLVLLSFFIFKNPNTTEKISFLHLLPIFLSFQSMAIDRWDVPNLFHKDFFAILIVILSLWSTEVFLKSISTEKEKMSSRLFYYTVALFLSFVLIGLFNYNAFESENIFRGVTLVIYSLIGVSLILYSNLKKQKFYLILGNIILGGVVLRLLFVEVWTMSLSGRIGTFVSIGILLILTAFFQKRLK